MNKYKQKYLVTLNQEKELVYKMFSKRDRVIGKFMKDPQLELLKYTQLLRKSEYYYNIYKGNFSKRKKISGLIGFMVYKRKRNKLGNKLGVDIRENSIDEGLQIFHTDIVVNGHARIGKNCKLHGNNCIGNDGISKDAPIIGNNVDIGYGATIIGNVKIVDNVVLGAGALVVKSILEPGVYVGIPAKKVG